MKKRADQLVEQGSPVTDPRLFRRCLGQFGTGVAIITASHAGQNVGVTVNSVASVSLDPPLVLWSLSKGSRSFNTFQQANGFAINILSKEQVELSAHFAGSATDKFADVAFDLTESGVPILNGSLAHIECTREAVHEGGDHLIIIGRVDRASRFEGDPLLFVQGRYVAAEELLDTAVVGSGVHDGVIPLLFDAHHSLSAKFDDDRRAEGLTPAEARILAALDGSDGMSAATIAKMTYVGLREAEDALAELCRKGETVGVAEGYALTDGGRQRREAIRQRWLDFQQREAAEVTPREMQAVLSVLGKLTSNANAAP